MERDGRNKSLWQGTKAVFGTDNSKIVDTLFDVIIVGGGITGITTAYELQKRGKKCLVVEARNLCFGTTGGTTAHLNSFFDTTYAEVATDFGKEGADSLALAARDALTMFSVNIEGLKITCDYRQMDGIVYAKDNEQVKELQEMYEAAIKSDVAVTYIDHIPIQDSFKRAISFKNQAQLHPVKYVYALAEAFEKEGGVIVENCFVKAVVQKEKLEVETSLGTIRCGKLIYATHIPPGVNLLHLRCAPYRSYAMAIELKGDQYPDAAVYDMADPYHYYRTQYIGNQKYLIAGGEDHKTGHEENTELPFEKLEKYLRKIFKIEQITYRWSSQYFEPADGLAYIGHLPGASENIFTATGFGGNGMTYSHIAANVLSAKIIQNIDLYEGLFSPARIKPIAGFTNFVKENADVVSSLITDRFSISKVESLASLRNDSAETVKYERHNLAIYKDETGELFGLNPTCTHLKCTVKWNQTEKSWDCPCHGARYSITGEVITGPANIPLERIELEKSAMTDNEPHIIN